jgi:Cof subfamily protein (haloacid dehalogenase superfamily)
LHPIRMVVVDLDGTALRSDGKWAEEGAALLKKAAANGIHVVIATTRNPESACSLAHDLGVSSPVICSNGAQVWGSPDGPVWATYNLSSAVALPLARWADEHDWELITTVGQETYWRWRPGQSAAPVHTRVTYVENNVDAIVGDPLRIMAWQSEAVQGIARWCPEHYPDLCNVAVFFRPNGSTECVGVFAPGVDKGRALRLVADRLEVPSSQIIALGDQSIDVPMFAEAGISVAMGNAPPEVRAAATWVAPSNDEEGVAWALRRCGLE